MTDEPLSQALPKRGADRTTEPVEDRLAKAMEVYLEQLEAGRRPNRRDFAARFPDIADQLDDHLKGLDFLHGAAADLTASQAPDSNRLQPQATLGDFRLSRPIGRGGMGIVYEAEQLSLGRTVAVKVLPFAAVLDEQQLKRFHNEARAAATLDHPNIVPVHFVGQERGVHFYAMQLIRGQSLAELIADLREEEGLPRIWTGEAEERVAVKKTADTAKHLWTAAASRSEERERRHQFAAEAGLQAAEALDHAHGVGIVHRDVKPGNLLIDATGKIWVTDFGLACFEHGETLTRTGGVVGTAAYMSPEQALGKRVFDPRTDVYSLGATLYKLLTLQPPALTHIAPSSQDLQPLRKIDNRVPADLETIVMKAMALDPLDRYQTAAAMGDDLRCYLEGRAILARPVGLLERGRRWVLRRRRLALAMSVTALLALVLMLAGMTIYSQQMADYAEQLNGALEAKERALLAEAAARGEADREGRVAQNLWRRAEASELKARRLTYRSDVALAFERFRENRLSDVERILARHVPTDPTVDLRGFEWYVLEHTLASRLVTLGRHHGSATACALYPDSRRAATVGEDGVINVWDLGTGEKLTTYEPGVGSLHALAISPDGSTLAIGGTPILSQLGSAAVYLGDAETGEKTKTLHRHFTTIESIAFSADGERVASAARYKTAKVSSVEGELLATFPADRRNDSIGFAAAGSALAILSEGSKRVGIWNGETGEKLRDLDYAYRMDEAVWSPRGTQLAVISGANWLNTIDAATGATLGWMRLSNRQRLAATALGFSPDGRELVAGDDMGRLHGWRIDEAQWRGREKAEPDVPRWSFSVHSERVTALANTPDGRLLSLSDDGAVKLSNPSANVAQYEETDFQVNSVASAAGVGEIFYGCSDGSVRRRKHSLAGTTVVARAAELSVCDLSVSDDGRTLAVVFDSGRVDVIDVAAESVLWTPRETSRRKSADQFAVAISSNGEFVAVTGFDYRCCLWNVAERKVIRRYSNSGMGRSVAFSRDSQRVAFGSDQIEVRTTRTGGLIRDFTNIGTVYSLSFAADFNILVSGAEDGGVRLFNLRDNQVRVLRGHEDAVSSVCFSPDDSRIVSIDVAQRLDSIRFWDVDSKEEIGALPNPLPAQPSDTYCRLIMTPAGMMICNLAAPKFASLTWPSPSDGPTAD